MRQRLYPETIPVLASYWLKTVYSSGHNRAWWADLDENLTQALREQPFDAVSREALTDIQTWMRQTILPRSKTPEGQHRLLPPFRANMAPDQLALYAGRLLNEWLPAEVAYLLTTEDESTISQGDGIPVLAIGRALERLLVRERLSPGTLEMLLQPELLSPKYVYPADAEMLRDVVLAMLGRTSGPPAPVMPASVICVAATSHLPADYSEAIGSASLVRSQERDEIHVPIASAQALEILKNDPVRIGSTIVTMDGRWWESESLQSGNQHVLVYRPGGRLRIDFTADHAKLTVPWPERELRWPGAVRFQEPLEIFGREWHASGWEMDGERAWFHLSFSRILPLTETPAAANMCLGRLRPASVEMAWSEMERALASSLSQKSNGPLEELRRSALIPLGRALYGLAHSMQNRRLRKEENIQKRLRAIRFLHAEVSVEYGRVPWRVLPAPVRGAFPKRHWGAASIELLNQIFDDLPEVFSAVPVERSSSSSQAA